MYTAKNFEHLLGTEGFSDTLLRNHFTLYEGYVNNTNKIVEKFDKNELQIGSTEYSEVQRRLGWEYNGMKLHELYFENLTKEKVERNLNSELYKKIESIYGNFESFEKSFRSVGAMRGIGWVALVKDNVNEELFTIWIDEHNTGNFADSKILLIMDVFEHAFITDYGIKRADYIAAFWNNINWKVVEERFNQ